MYKYLLTSIATPNKGQKHISELKMGAKRGLTSFKLIQTSYYEGKYMFRKSSHFLVYKGLLEGVTWGVLTSIGSVKDVKIHIFDWIIWD